MFRRKFIATGVAASTTLSLGLARNTFGIEPFRRPDPTKIRLSLAAYSMRKYLSPKPDEAHKMDLFDFVDFCHAQGLTGTELTSYYFPEDFSDDYILKLKRHCQILGLTVSGGAIRNDFCSGDEAKVAADIAHTKQWVDHYALLGAPAIRIFAGNAVEGEETSVTLARCAKNCELACEYAEKKGVLLALENHGGVTARAEGLLEIVKQVNASAFGVNFDCGNFRSTEDPYAELAMIAPYAVNAQIKVDIYPGGKHEETDLERVIKILRDAGYSGWVALEYEANEEPLEAIPRWLDKLRPLVDG